MSTSRLMNELRARMGGVPKNAPGGRQTDARRPRKPQPSKAQSFRRLRPQRDPCTDQGKGSVDRLDPLRPKDPKLLASMKGHTPAKVAVGRSGLRYRTQTALQFLADFAVAQAAVDSQVPPSWAEQQGWMALQTEAADPEQFLTRPDLGRALSEQTIAHVAAHCRRNPDVQIVVGDGLSAAAVMQNAPGMVGALSAELERRGLSVGTVLFVRHSRARIVDLVGKAVGAKVGIILLGERPGLGTGDGMSAYLVWDPSPARTDAEKQAISNVHQRGLLPEQAGMHAANVIEQIMRQQTSGVTLDLSGVEIPKTEKIRQNQANPDAALGCGQSHGQQCEACDDGQPGQVCNRTDADGRPCHTHTH